jgi:hypothetical protein
MQPMRILAMAQNNPFRHRIVKRWSVLNPFCARLTTGSMVNKQKLVEEAAGQGFNAVLVARFIHHGEPRRNS